MERFTSLMLDTYVRKLVGSLTRRDKPDQVAASRNEKPKKALNKSIKESEKIVDFDKDVILCWKRRTIYDFNEIIHVLLLAANLTADSS